MRLVKPKKPLQDNFTDCGVYLLHYVEKIFSKYSTYLPVPFNTFLLGSLVCIRIRIHLYPDSYWECVIADLDSGAQKLTTIFN
jgi:hypothetical protein